MAIMTTITVNVLSIADAPHATVTIGGKEGFTVGQPFVGGAAQSDENAVDNAAAARRLNGLLREDVANNQREASKAEDYTQAKLDAYVQEFFPKWLSASATGGGAKLSAEATAWRTIAKDWGFGTKRKPDLKSIRDEASAKVEFMAALANFLETKGVNDDSKLEAAFAKNWPAQTKKHRELMKLKAPAVSLDGIL